jgi:hypothetical protein
MNRGGEEERFDVKFSKKIIKKSSDAAALQPTIASEQLRPPLFIFSGRLLF